MRSEGDTFRQTVGQFPGGDSSLRRDCSHALLASTSHNRLFGPAPRLTDCRSIVNTQHASRRSLVRHT